VVLYKILCPSQKVDLKICMYLDMIHPNLDELTTSFLGRWE
jgi:hypothetical protein